MAQNSKGSVHSGHRERVKAKFHENGLEVFADHEVLEFLLYYTISRQDTNPLGHELLNKFGSLSKVFDADYKDLVSVHGISEHSATLIKLIPQMCRRYSEDKQTSNSPILSTPAKTAEFVKSLFIGRTEEELYMICMDKVCRLIKHKRISRGSLDSTALNLRLIADTVVKHKVSRVILAHNHPSGLTAASDADIKATYKVKELLESIHVQLDDHFIVTAYGALSMRNLGII